jgi:glycosyltransferase involved in cell wall biosynthesis
MQRPVRATSPRISIIVPIHNEAAILRGAVGGLSKRLREHGLDYELVLSENGSRDATPALARELADTFPELRVISSAEPNYGAALRQGIRAARGIFVICEEIDLCNVDFHLEALSLLEQGADLVVGSKLAGGARDERPFIRHAASVVYSRALRVLVGYPGTDTHGLKAFRRERLLPVVDACVVDRDVFASELVIRAYRAGLDVREIPTRVKELRPPSINLLNRVPHVVRSLVKLTWAVRRHG